MATYPNGICIEEMLKLNGKTRWNVYCNGEQVGQFWTKQRAQAFVDNELLPSLIAKAGL